jgi:hypothetical protein
VNLGLVDALCRRLELEPALPLRAALRRPLFDVVGVCDFRPAISTPNASKRPPAYFFFAVFFFAVFLAAGFFAADFVFDFVAFFAMLPSV